MQIYIVCAIETYALVTSSCGKYMYINIVLALIFAVNFDTFFRVINLLVFYFFETLKT